ncbi:MAG: ECF-type sigma factor [Planctomycetales bacterium]
MTDVTTLLSGVQRGDPRAAEELLLLVYTQLRELAVRRLGREKPGQTLQATALVHEAYLRLVSGKVESNWNSRAHFFGAAAEAMRRILVETARRKRRLKRGGGRARLSLNIIAPAVEEMPCNVLDVDAALSRLAAVHPRKAELVKLRYFAGLTQSEAAGVLGVSTPTADRDWRYARAWLARELRNGSAD